MTRVSPFSYRLITLPTPWGALHLTVSQLRREAVSPGLRAALLFDLDALNRSPDE